MASEREIDDDLYVVIVTARPEKRTGVLVTVAAYVTDEPCEAARLKERAERETGGTACVNRAPFVSVPEAACFRPM